MELPQDPYILLSFINTLLRDTYSSLAALCDDMQIDCDELKAKLREAGFEYISTLNQFR